MTNIVGVKFKNVMKVYYFKPNALDLHYDDKVIVETARGLQLGTVVMSPLSMEEDKLPEPLKDVVRVATPEDIERAETNEVKSKEAYKICKEKIKERGLEMKLIRAEYMFDSSKILFYFTADGRVDFRELVKDLAGVFRTRIELRQVGVRDETKLLGGIGSCGRALCCHTFLTEFAPVSIRMAKAQNLSLNPSKISGTCGRLMCCLKNEAETYEYLSKGLPSKGDQMTTPEGRHGEVQSVDILRQRVKCVVDLENDEKELQEYHITEITFIPHSKRPKGQQNQKKKEEEAAVADAAGTDDENKAAQKNDASDGEGAKKPRRRRRRHHKNKNGAQGGDAPAQDANA